MSDTAVPSGRAFALAGCLGAATAFAGIRRIGLHRLIRRQVSERGGNLLSFVLMKRLIESLYSVLGPLDIQGAGYIPRTGGVLIAANHNSDADPTAVYAAAPRWVWFPAKGEAFDLPLVGAFLRYYHGLPIRHGNHADASAMKDVLKLLKAGEVVVIFPAGRVSRNSKLQAFQPGAAMLALRSGVPVIPVAISGTEKIVPQGSVLPRPSHQKVQIRFGEPINLSGLPEGNRHEKLAEATRRIQSGVKSLLQEICPESAAALAG